MVGFQPLWTIMDTRNIKSGRLRVKIGLRSIILARLLRNESVALDVLVRICEALNCQLSDICTVYLRNEA